MKNTLLFQNKTELDAAVSEIPFETKAIAYESDTDTHWFSSYIDKSAIVYNTVDLGLPSGLLWADKNIGARTPEEGGLYFQWGDTKGYTAEQVGTNEGQKEFSSSYTDYKFGTEGNFTKYNGSDSKTVLDPEDDAAHVLMGGNWRLPTHEELHELVTNTDMFLVPTEGEEIEATISYDRYPTGETIFNFATTASTCTGMKFYKKNDHSVYLFVPAVGAAGAGSVMNGVSTGGLWSSSADSSNVRVAWNLYFHSVNGNGTVYFFNRYFGFPLRGVSPSVMAKNQS